MTVRLTQARYRISRLSRRLFAALAAGCAALLLECPAVAQPASINPGLIANESRRQQLRMERDIARRQRLEPFITIDKPTVKRPAKPKRQRR